MFTLFVIVAIILTLIVLYYAAFFVMAFIGFCIRGYELATGKITLDEMNKLADKYKKNRAKKKAREKKARKQAENLRDILDPYWRLRQGSSTFLFNK